MTTALTTLTPAEQAILDADRNKSSGVPQIPQIRLSNKDMKQAPEGEYFIELYKGKDIEPEIDLLGPNPVIIPIYKTSTYSYYTKEDGLIAWTSDIHGFSALDRVTLFMKKDGKVTIDFDGPYTDFKVFAAKKYTQTDPVTGKPKKLLKFKTVLYVMFNDKPHKMFVSNASSAGVNADGLPSFDQPQQGSLQLHTDKLWQSKMAIYEMKVELGSRYVTSNKDDETPNKIVAKAAMPFYIMTFMPVGENEKLGTTVRAKVACEQAITAIDDMRRGDAKAASTVVVAETSEAIPEIDYADGDIKVEDLPF